MCLRKFHKAIGWLPHIGNIYRGIICLQSPVIFRKINRGRAKFVLWLKNKCITNRAVGTGCAVFTIFSGGRFLCIFFICTFILLHVFAAGTICLFSITGILVLFF